MGKFLNPNNDAFQVALNSNIYVDKTELLIYTNKSLNTNQSLICNSRPRRFGKSITANMLAAYYSKGCNSEEMFSNLAISKDKDFKTHLNKYDVIYFDIQWCMTAVKDVNKVVSYIENAVIKELKEVYKDTLDEPVLSLPEALSNINTSIGKKFIVIIDEWDALIRDEATNITVQETYINFLRGMFKGTEPTKFISLAFLTGILPIKKMKTQSALNNFDEFTMIDASVFAAYIGFTEDEVNYLCEKYQKNFDDVKHWYDGYEVGEFHVYNPKAVVSVMLRNTFQSYWSQTGTYESILPLINMDFDGLKTAIIEMISGANVEVDVRSFQNDMISFSDKDDILTLLIHLGYLAYNPLRQIAWIPNEEIRQEFITATKKKKWNEFLNFQKKSTELLYATLDMDEQMVAESIEKIHTYYASTISYNDENSLSSVLTIAYLSTMQYYFKPIRELPTGRGFADFVYLPKTEYIGEYPALLIELKWNKTVKTAMEQIKERNYVSALKDYTGDILLVGINYDKKKKEHQCEIEKFLMP